MISQVITGGIMVVAGLFLMALPLFTGVGGFVAWIYGLPLFLFGIFILMNSKEDKIEERKDIKNHGAKK